MRLKKVKNADIDVKNSSYTINEPLLLKGKWKKEFKNDNEIHIEIGSGRGQFIIAKAMKNPNINFIGIEVQDSALVKAVKKLDNLECNLPNLRLLRIDAFNLNEVFENEISCIYLNFSDPWPKKRHTKRRLTSPVFLKVYDSIFINKKKIIQKTDNIDLFEYSIESFSQYGYKLDNISYDYNDVSNIETEYEEKFRKQGIKINYLEATK